VTIIQGEQLQFESTHNAFKATNEVNLLADMQYTSSESLAHLQQFAESIENDSVLELVLEMELDLLEGQKQSLLEMEKSIVINQGLELKLKKPSYYLEGLKWSSGLHENKCTIDDPLSLLALRHNTAHPNEEFIKYLQENKCLRVKQLAVMLELVPRGTQPLVQSFFGDRVTEKLAQLDLHGNLFSWFI